MIKNKRNLIIGIIFVVALTVAVLMLLFYKKPQKTEEVIIPEPVKTVKKVEVSESFPVYSYDAQQLRDPFAPLIVKREEHRKGVSPLESYDIEELKLTGVIWDKKGGGMALIEAPDGRFYIVKVNDRIGLSGGRITKILKDAVEIKDNKKTKYMKLRIEEGG